MADTLVTAEPTAPVVTTPASPVTPAPVATPVAPLTPSPTDWRASLPDDLKADKGLEKFKGPADLARAYKQIEAYQGRSVAIPGPDAKPEERDAFWAKVGRPETPEKYTLPLPEGLPVDDGMAGDFKQTAHRLGLTQEQVAGVVAWYTGSPVGNPAMASEQLQTTAVATLKGEWGGAYDHNLRVAQEAVRYTDRMSGAGLLPLLEQSGMGNHPAVLKHFKWLGGHFSEAGAMPKNATTGGILSPQDAQRQIDAIYADKNHPYHGGQGRVAQESAREEMHQLFQLKSQS